MDIKVYDDWIDFSIDQGTMGFRLMSCTANMETNSTGLQSPNGDINKF